MELCGTRSTDIDCPEQRIPVDRNFRDAAGYSAHVPSNGMEDVTPQRRGKGHSFFLYVEVEVLETNLYHKDSRESKNDTYSKSRSC
jgi:hypothetical protein